MKRQRPKHGIQRIVSLAPNVTSILLALGAHRELVGVTKWCKDVADVRARPQVGDCWKLDLDEVMKLKPTLLIGSVPFSPETVSRILAQPVRFLAINPRSLADIEKDIRLLGRVVGRPQRAEGLLREMRQGFANLALRAQAFRTQRKPRVYCEAWPNPRISSPPWVTELIELAGGKNIVRAGATVTDEQVALGKPDVIVLAWAATGDRAKREPTLRNPLWKATPAVKTGRVLVIRDELLNTPGPPLLKGAPELFRAIHPQLTQEKLLR
jgi:iron complex transport system substrate-binding protein